jgi:hypothetical protein
MKILIYIYLFILIISPKRYIYFLPSLYVYPHNETEIIEVEKKINTRNQEDIDFFYLTDRSVSHAFTELVPYTIEELDYIISQVNNIILFLKYIINRARPNQIKPNLNALKSNTAQTPSYPAGHAFQAYYLSKILGKKYPELQHQLNITAEKCNNVRISAGLHYPSDGLFAKNIVDSLIYF